MNSNVIRRIGVSLTCLILAALIGVVAVGCGKKEEAPPEGVTPPIAVAPKKVPTPMELLQYAPETTTIAVAMPPVNGLYAKVAALAERLGYSSEELEAGLLETMDEVYEDLELPAAETLPEKLAAMGIDGSAPIGVYFDMESMFEDIEELMKAQQQIEASTEAGAGDATDELLKEMTEDAMEPTLPATAKLFTCIDVGKAEEHTRALLGQMDGVDLSTEETIDAQGQTIHRFSDGAAAYFVAGNRLVAGNSYDMVEGVAARLANPATLAYSAGEVNVGADTLVAFTRLDRLMELSRDMMEASALVAPPELAQLMGLSNIPDAYTDDPMVTTLDWNDSVIAIANRINLARHPNAQELLGAPEPMRLSSLLPAETMALYGFRISDAAKEQLTTGLENPDEAGDMPPMMLQSLGVAGSILSWIGNEVSIGVIGPGMLIPEAAILVDVADEAALRELLASFGMSLQEVETYNDVALLQVPAPLPSPIHAAIFDNTLVIANNLDRLKGLVDGAKSGSTGPLFEGLNPPLKGGTARYNAFIVRNSLYHEVVKPLVMMQGGTDIAAEMPELEQAMQVFRELRMDMAVDGDWVNQAVTVYMTSPEPGL
jgi:hypothetical protein